MVSEPAPAGNAYTEKDAVRAAKEVTAIMTELHGTIRKAAEASGKYLAIMDELNAAPIDGSVYTTNVETAFAAMGAAYEQLRNALIYQ